jgi:hypothetical protein
MDADLLPGLVAGGAASVRPAAAAVAAGFAVALLVGRRHLSSAASVARLLEGLSETMLEFERWVIEPLFGATMHLVAAAAWTAGVVDAEIIAAPADAAARRIVRAAAVVRPVVGGSIERVFWVFTAFFATACVAHGLWPAR